MINTASYFFKSQCKGPLSLALVDLQRLANIKVDLIYKRLGTPELENAVN